MQVQLLSLSRYCCLSLFLSSLPDGLTVLEAVSSHRSQWNCSWKSVAKVDTSAVWSWSFYITKWKLYLLVLKYTPRKYFYLCSFPLCIDGSVVQKINACFIDIGMGRHDFCFLRISWAALNVFWDFWSNNIDFQVFSGLISPGVYNMMCRSLFPAVHQNEPSLRNSVVSFVCFIKYKFANALPLKAKYSSWISVLWSCSLSLWVTIFSVNF